MLPFLIILLASQALAGNLCYFPGGVQSHDVPCDPTAQISMCCGSVAACLSNGLCKDESTTNSTGVAYARGTCTDPQWASPICPQQCQLNQDTPKNSSAYDFRLNGVQVWECNAQGFGTPANYCCESAAEKTRCCATATALFSLLAASQGNALAVQTAVAGTTTKATSTAPVSSTQASGATAKNTDPGVTTAPSAPVSSGAAAATSAKGIDSASAVPETNSPKESSSPSNSNGNDKGSSGYSTAAVVGIGVGASAASAIVVVVFVVFLLKRKQKKEAATDGLSYYGRPPSSTSQYRYGPDRDIWYDGRRTLPAGALPRLDMAQVDSFRHSPVDRYASPAISELEPTKLSPVLGRSPRQKSRLFEMP